MNDKNKITQQYLKSILEYDLNTGLFIWKVNISYKMRTGAKAGTINNKGYVTIGFDGKSYLAHRLAWLYVHGYLPEKFLDHINRNKADNRIYNLREVTNSENMRNTDMRKNNKTGIQGVSNFGEKFVARVRVDGQNIYLGVFDYIEEAQFAYNDAETKYNRRDYSVASDYVRGMM